MRCISYFVVVRNARTGRGSDGGAFNVVKRVPGGFRRVGSGVGSGVVVVSIVVGIQRRRRHSFAFGILFVVMHWSHVHLKKRRIEQTWLVIEKRE